MAIQGSPPCLISIVPPAAPAWYTGANFNEWVAIGNALQGSGVEQQTAGGTLGSFRSATGAFDLWCGGIHVTQGLWNDNTFYPGSHIVLPGQGGHANYFGNENYAFDVYNATWRRITDASAGPYNGASRLQTNYPCSSHGYGTIVYVPNRNEIWRMAASSPGGSGGDDANPTVDYFDCAIQNPRANRAWNLRGFSPNSFSDSSYTHYAAYGYNQTDGKIYTWGIANGTTQLTAIDPAALTRTVFAKSGVDTIPHHTAVDQNRQLMLVYGSNGTTYAFDLRNPSANNGYQLSRSGVTLPGGSGCIAWDSAGDRFVVWPTSGKTIYFINPPATSPYQGGNAWTVTNFTPAGGSTPASGSANGTWGRSGMLPAPYRGFICIPNSTSPAYVFKMA